MKYTRYDLNMKKRKNERKKMILSVLGVILIAVLIGTLLYKTTILQQISGEINKTISSGEQNTENKVETDNNNNQVTNNDDKTESNTVTSEQKGDKETYVMVQCGYYSKKENADAITTKLEEKVVAVSVKEEDKFRVIAYIGNEEDAQKLSDELTVAEISNAKARFTIPRSDLCNNEIIEVINGYLQIIDKLNDKTVKSVKSKEFKDWTNSLKEETNGVNFNLFKELKTAINALPEEVTKDNIESSYEVIYKVLSSFRV